MNIPIISSNCKNGPSEFLDNGNGGILFNSNDKKVYLIVFLNLKVLNIIKLINLRLTQKNLLEIFQYLSIIMI